MNKYNKCPRCRKIMTQIPIKRLDSLIILELYCEKCDESVLIYHRDDKIKIGTC
jgi:hypothetical protein